MVVDIDAEPNVYPCDRCLRVFDIVKIVQGRYGTRHCNKCVNELHRHELHNRRQTWARPPLEEAPSISIRYLENQV